MRHLLHMGFGLLAALLLMAEAAADSGVYVEIRASDATDAQVVDRWRLYAASHALVIGIDNYTSGWPSLSNAVEDASLVAGELRQQGFEVVLLTDVTGAQLREALRRFFAFKGRDSQARLFVWFAGHGHTEDSEGYLVPADAPPPGSAEFNYVALHMGDVGSMVRIAQSKHVLAVFDSCFAGTIFSSQRARPPAAITAAVKRPVRQFLTSGDAEQQVSDDGTFRTLFLRALRGEETADANRDGYLTGTELSLYLEDRIVNLTQGAQTPRSGKLRDPRFDQGDFVFVLPGQAPTLPSPDPGTPGLSEEAAYELAFWGSIKDSTQAEVYEAYLTQYPDGAFAALARLKIRAYKPRYKMIHEGPQTATLPPPAPVAKLPSTPTAQPEPTAPETAAVTETPPTPVAKPKLGIEEPAQTLPEVPPPTLETAALQAEAASEPPEPAPSEPLPEPEEIAPGLGEVPVAAESATPAESLQVARLPAAPEVVPETAPEPHFEVTLSREEKRRIQRSLRDLGLYHSGIDGQFGRGTRGAISEFQESIGSVPTGYLNAAQAERLHARAAQASTGQPQSEPQPQRQTVALPSTPAEEERETGGATLQPALSEIERLIQMAEAGDAVAQAELGLRYLHGRGVTKDPKEALNWSLKAAKQGNAKAQSNVGFMYMTESGTEKNEIEAARWWREAARQGQPQAQFNLGSLYENGHGVKRDYEQAAEWYRLASAQGYAHAKIRLERLYARGVATPPH